MSCRSDSYKNSELVTLEVGKNKSGLRKLKLHVQMSIDGCIAGPNGEMDWMVGLSDDKLIKYENDLMESIDTILLGRKMTMSLFLTGRM